MGLHGRVINWELRREKDFLRQSASEWVMTKAEQKSRAQWLDCVTADLKQLTKSFKGDRSRHAQRVRKMAGSLKARVQAAKADAALSTRKVERDLRQLMDFVAHPEHL